MQVLHPLARLSSASVLLLCSCLTFAQTPAPRLRGPIEATPSIPLEGSLNPHVRLADDLGPLSSDTLIPGVTLVFKRSSAQESDLQQLLAQQTNPSSPLYHQWLTSAEFTSRFGVAPSDIASTQSWLQSHGLTIDSVSPDRITFSGTAAQIQQAFATELHRYRSRDDDAQLHFAPSAGISLPPALAPLTAAVLHLSDFRPAPSARAIHPDFTALSTQKHYLAPGDISTMYDLGPLLANYTGAGQSIAIAGQSFVPTDNDHAIAHFHALVAQGNVITPIIVPGSGNEATFPGDEGESNIDLEYSSAIAPSANIFFVFTGVSTNYDVFDAVAYAITQDIAPVISVSYGACEALMSPSVAQQFNSLFQQAAAQGQTIVASSGDSGATACAPYSSSSGVTLTQQQQLAAGFPSSSPWVTSIGGTQMAPGTIASGANQYWAAATAIDNRSSLLSYVPEVVWNESSPTFGIASSGGGASSLFARPAWQTGVPGIPSGAFRLTPDIALQASIQNPGYLLCTDDVAFLGNQSDCLGGTATTSNGNYIVSGGTSFAAPIFAGFLALLNQSQHTIGLGSINPVLYSLAAQPAVYASAFHDITSGTSACVMGDGNCGTPGSTSYAATTGYDMATGLGSVDFNRLAISWPSTTPANLTPTTVYFGASTNVQTNGTASPAATVSLTVNVSSAVQGNGSLTPTGTVSITVDGQLVNSSLALTPAALTNSPPTASAAFSFIAPSTTGSHIVIARYPGDAQHLPSTATYTVLVGNVVPSGSFTLSAGSTTVSSNSTTSTHITVTPSGGYSGSLTWSASVSGGTVAQTICYLVQPAAVNGPTTITMQLGVGTACSGPSGSRAPSSVQGFAQRAALDPPRLPSRQAPAAATFIALALCTLLPSRRTRKLLPILSTLTLAILSLGLTGCGGNSTTGTGGGGGGGGGSNIQPQVYTLTLTAKDSVNTSITASTSFTLTVNQ